MPTYGYQCKECKHEFSVFQNMKDDPIATCPDCRGSVKRLLYPVGVVFKGSGWYINDSRKPDKSETGESKPAEAKSEESKADGAKTSEKETKSDTKSEPAPVAAAQGSSSEKS